MAEMNQRKKNYDRMKAFQKYKEKECRHPAKEEEYLGLSTRQTNYPVAKEDYIADASACVQRIYV